MPVFSPFEREQVRVRLVLGGMLLAFLCLGVFLWRVQVLYGARYEVSLREQSMRRVRIPGRRGRIFDRSGECLADNRPSYCIALYLEELRQPGNWDETVHEVQRVVAQLSGVLGIAPELTEEAIRAHIKRRRPLPLIAWRDVSHATLARLAEQRPSVPGVDIYTEAIRVYPHGSLACHVLGYTGRTDPPAEGEPYYYYLPEMAGKRGIERRFDTALRGRPGGVLIRVDVSGYKHHERYLRKAESGEDVFLALDTHAQRLAERALAGVSGAVVVLDPRNGDVLALASGPAFDPNHFSPAISRADWQTLLADADRPLFNRAISGRYPPGSTFKPIVAIAAWENRRVSPGVTYTCAPGGFKLGDTIFHCWEDRGHGPLQLSSALERSCNVFFYRLALDCTYPYIYHMARALGLGSKTGIALDGESAGILPDNAWTLRKRGHRWRQGDTCNAAVGQGYITVTPLQMAVVVAAIANGGDLYKPRLVLGSRRAGAARPSPGAARPVRNMNWSAETLRLIRAGMHGVVHGVHGTARAAAVPGLEMAGKTGTAEYGPKEENKKRGWMTAYAPFDRPRYAVCIVVDDVESASLTVAPRLRALMMGLFGINTEDRT